jgi:tRNA(Ile)-lysidine synthase TilS/MesJ/sulfur carrier protein ThiS
LATTVVFRNKTGGTDTLTASAGQTLLDVLRANGVPANAVLAYRDGHVVPEDTTVLGVDDLIELRQVRHYDLDVLRKPKVHTYATADPVYTKTVLFDQAGTLERRSEQLNAASFVEYVEKTFVQSVLSAKTMRAGDRVVIGLSGGRDSVAYLKLLERTRGAWPEVDMTAVTITGLPDWEEPATFSAALAACEGLGVEHVIVTADEVADLFHLREPFVDVMSRVVAGEHRNMNMVIGHQVLRRMLEREADRRGAGVVAFGFNADDLVASMVTWFTTGYRMGGIPVRELGGMRYVFPLYRITKKELTLYLELVAPEQNRQGPPGRFATGPDERSMAYAMADHLYDLWPGVDYYLFSAFDNVQRSLLPPVDDTCRVCGGLYLLQEGVPNPAGLCDVCGFFQRQEVLRADFA